MIRAREILAQLRAIASDLRGVHGLLIAAARDREERRARVSQSFVLSEPVKIAGGNEELLRGIEELRDAINEANEASIKASQEALALARHQLDVALRREAFVNHWASNPGWGRWIDPSPPTAT